ncbi:MAG: hypothetical protein Phog2KO_34440 [Phototrophicaceae bacterium]
MAKLKQSLRKVQETVQSFINTVVGREEENTAEQASLTQRNQYFT